LGFSMWKGTVSVERARFRGFREVILRMEGGETRVGRVIVIGGSLPTQVDAGVDANVGVNDALGGARKFNTGSLNGEAPGGNVRLNAGRARGGGRSRLRQMDVGDVSKRGVRTESLGRLRPAGGLAGRERGAAGLVETQLLRRRFVFRGGSLS